VAGVAALLLGTVLTAALVGCGDNGDGRYAGLSTYESADGSFLIRYRKPPWKLIEAKPSAVTLQVERAGVGLVNVDAGASDTPAILESIYWFTARLVSGTAMACVDAALAAMPEGSTVVQARREVETAHGDKGFDASYSYPIVRAERYVRVTCLSHPGADALELRFDSSKPLKRAEVDEMIAGVEIRTAESP